MKISFFFFSFFLRLCKNNNMIDIAMALDDNYIYPTIVAITSIMLNSNSNSKINFFIMHPPELKIKNKEKILKLENKFPKCKIRLINMGEKYKEANQNDLITTPTYYRLSLPEILPNLHRIIWIDGDTLTFSDLEEMYNLNMTGLHFKGFLDETTSCVDVFRIENDHCICAGVMLVNLDELTKDDMVSNYSKFIEKYNKKLFQHDQTIINAVSVNKIGILPAKYGMFNYKNINHLKDNTDGYRCKNGYSIDERLEAYFYPGILHFVYKPWKNKKENRKSLWWDYAKKTDYYYQMFIHYYWYFYFKKFIKILIIIFFIFILFYLLRKKKFNKFFN